MRTIFHIDVNSAFLSWSAAELLKNGGDDIRKVPSIIGGNENRRKGIVLAKSESAKKFKIVTGETLYQARKKCKNLLVIPPDYELYLDMSEKMKEVLYNYSPLVEPFSIDECFLDYTGSESFFGDPLTGAKAIRDEIYEKLGFTVNIGISSNKVLAKMASDFEKPNKIHTLYPQEIEEKMWPLSVGELFMVGKKTAESLRNRGIYTIYDLAHFNQELLVKYFGKFGVTIWNYANGIDPSPVEPQEAENKGIGASTTTMIDVKNIESGERVLLGLCETIGNRLRGKDMVGTVISVNVKNSEFVTTAKQISLATPTNITNVIFDTAKILFAKLWNGEPLRHLGVSISRLSKNVNCQLTMDCIMTAANGENCAGDTSANKNDKNESIDKAVDKIRGKYGNGAISRGTFVNSELKPMQGNTKGKMYTE